MKSAEPSEKGNSRQLVLCSTLVFLGVAPLAPWFALLTHAWRVRLYLGRWPEYNDPDPKEIPIDFQPQTKALECLLPIVVLLLIVISAVALLRLTRTTRIRSLIAVTVFLAGWAISIALFLLDPGGFFEWILD